MWPTLSPARRAKRSVVKCSRSPRSIKECLKPFGVFFDKTFRLLRKFGTRSREVIKCNGFERRSGCQTKHAVSPDQKSGLSKGVLALQVHRALDDCSSVEHAAALDLTVSHTKVLIATA